MADPDRRPTAQEIEELIDLVRRDPSSSAFIDLAEAYLNLGRPKDAISVANVGLQAAPDSLEGRVMLARAHCALHQWKEAQGELLRVVKVDRSNRLGFSLLGEVLLRRNDHERAVPVLQHAQNLDPTSPQILAMLKRARAGQGLDAPPPIPSPVPPRGETNYALQLPTGAAPQSAPPRRSAAQPAPQLPPQAPTIAMQPAPAAPAPRAPKQTAPPPPVSIEGVCPRVIPQAKPQNAASAALRQSAAVGENYLNDLLTGGLLDVAGVRVPDSDFDLRPDRRWGRSTRRAFIFLFVVLVFGIGGGGTWYWWSEKQKAEQVALLQREAKAAIGGGEYAGLETSITKLREALEKDKKNRLSLAYFAEAASLEALLYGTDNSLADPAIKSAKTFDPGEDGEQQLVIARAAADLARLTNTPTRDATLADVRKGLDEYLAKHADDPWAIWLKARALLAAGNRNDGRALLGKAVAADKAGFVLAMIDTADLLADEGKVDEAIALYDKVLALSPKHPLAVVGKSLARAESTVDADKAIEDLNTQLGEMRSPRIDAYKELAKALANAKLESYASANLALTTSVAKPPVDPRFWADVTWAYLQRGELDLAAKARGNIAPYAGTDPAVVLVGAGFVLATGLPDKALDIASKLEGVRAGVVRAYADLDLGKAADAVTETEKILALSPGNIEAQILHAEAQMISGTGKVRAAATEELEGLARKANSKLGRHALGMAYYLLGDLKNAQPQLEAAVTDIKEETPNPLSYRTRTALADILFKNNDLAGAQKQLEEAFKTNSGFFPSLALSAQLSVKTDPDHAIELLGTIANETTLTPQMKLVLAEAIATHKLDVNKKPCACPTEQEKGNARKLLEEIKDAIQPASEVGRVAALIDPKLPAELGVPTPDGTPAPDKSGGGSHHHRGHR
jgi:tetratricopeptide (TPR) repeat protein